MQMLLARTVAALYNAVGVTQNLEVSDLHQSKASEEQEEQSMMGLEIGFDEVGLTWMEILWEEFEHVAARKTWARRLDERDYRSMDEAGELVLVCKLEVSRYLLAHIQAETVRSYFWMRMTEGWPGGRNWRLSGCCLYIWS